MLIMQLLLSMDKLIQRNEIIAPKLSDVAVSFSDEGIANARIKLWETTPTDSLASCFGALVQFINDIFENWKVYDLEL